MLYEFWTQEFDKFVLIYELINVLSAVELKAVDNHR